MIDAVGVERVPTTIDIGKGDQLYGLPLEGTHSYRLPSRRQVQMQGLIEYAGLMVSQERAGATRRLLTHAVVSMVAVATLTM